MGTVIYTCTIDPGLPAMRAMRVFDNGIVETCTKEGDWISDTSDDATKMLRETIEFLCRNSFVDMDIVGCIDVFTDGRVRFRLPNTRGLPTESDEMKLANALRDVMKRRP